MIWYWYLYDSVLLPSPGSPGQWRTENLKYKYTYTKTRTHSANALFIYVFIAYGCRKRGAEGVREVAGNHVFEQVAHDHRVWGASVNDLFMDPSGPSQPLGLHQTDAKGERETDWEEGRCKGREEWCGTEERNNMSGQRWREAEREGGKTCIKWQTQKQDERGGMGCGRETERERTDHYILTLVSVLGHSQNSLRCCRRTNWLVWLGDRLLGSSSRLFTSVGR